MEWRSYPLVKDLDKANHSVALILGNQLFPKPHLPELKTKNFVMVEDYGLCTHFKYHKHKIIFFLSSMRRYKQYLEDNKYKVSYYSTSHKLFKKPFEEKLSDYLSKNRNISSITTFEIEDKFFETKLITFCKKNRLKLIFINSPMFVTTRSCFKGYLSTVKKPFMKSFYQQQRKQFDILLTTEKKPKGGKWSFDDENRNKLPKDITFCDLPKITPNEIVNEVAQTVEKHFQDHPGESTSFWLPTSRKEALFWLNDFLHHRFSQFGAYQDSITNESDFVFHSVISPMLNAGLITPIEVIKKAESYANEHDIPMNSVEGFIRQVLGWREFVRGVYQNYSEIQWKTNFWNHHRTLKPCWYTGNTGVEVLDDAIKKTVRFSYAHHIERLMVLSNFMLLCEIHPQAVYQWFMEMFSDSSDWVMGPNVFGMGQFSDGGIFATKPYICGSNYILKMSRYPKGQWCDVMDGLYWRFIEKHKKFYNKNPRVAVMTRSLEKMNPDRKKKIFKAAQQFIDKTTFPAKN